MLLSGSLLRPVMKEPLPLFNDQAFFFQKGEGQADSLAAYPETAAQLLLGRKFFNSLLNIGIDHFLKPVGQPLILDCHKIHLLKTKIFNYFQKIHT